MTKQKKIPIPTPGDILLEEFLKPMGISQYRLAKELHVSPMKISEIINGKRSITANTALRLGKFFSMNPLFWLNLQNQHDMRKESKNIGKSIEDIHPYKDVA